MVSSSDNRYEHEANDVQTYLISKYREALKSGDKSYAKSCLLSTRLFSVNDPNITNEIYMMAKSDGDVSEAAKCFVTIFNDLLLKDSSSQDLATETLIVVNQIKEEIRLLLNELKAHSLKLKSSSMSYAAISSGQQTRQTSSVTQSPTLSPRLRMSSEDRSTTKESVIRLDSHLHSATKGFFYHQLFDDLPKEVKENLLSYSIENCDNPFERCRLMMLNIIIFSETVAILGPRLLRTLMDLSSHPSEKTNDVNDKILGTSRPPAMCHHAKSMLVLDAIPLVFSLNESLKLDVQINELMAITLDFYSENCLETAANEYELDELHEGLKKTIAARILGKDLNNTPDDMIGENLIISLNLLMDKYLNELCVDDETMGGYLKELRSIVEQRSNKLHVDLDAIIKLINNLELEEDIPESILFQSSGATSDSKQSLQQSTSSTPSKGRGRPKKVQPSVIVSPDDGVRRNLEIKARVAHFVFFSLTQLMFRDSLEYLKQTKSRILIRFDNPIATLIESELSKSSSQRSSRSTKNSSQDTNSNLSKKIKLEHGAVDEKPASSCSLKPDIKFNPQIRVPKDSPLNSEQSRKLDTEILVTLQEIYKCIEFLSSSSTTMSKIWLKFNESNNCNELIWYSRVFSDSMLISGNYEQAIKKLNQAWVMDDEPQIKKDPNDTETSTLTVGSSSLGVGHMRAGSQLISCYIQQQDKENTFQSINNLLVSMISSGMLKNDGGYSTGDIINEYMILVATKEEGENDSNLGFLFFDTLSLLRYVVGIFIDIMRKHVNRLSPTSDTTVGHSIVLSQLDWPKESPLYEHCIAWLRANKPKSITPQGLSAACKFTYPQFFQFVTDPNMIEDFLALLNEGYTLDIATRNSSFSSEPSASVSQSSAKSISATAINEKSTRAGKTMTTRGVNRNFKDHLKYMLVNQMEHSTTLVSLEMLTNFIVTRLLPYFMPNC